MEGTVSKQEARAWGKSQRAALSKEAIEGWRNMQVQVLFHTLDMSKVNVCHVFLPMLNQAEPDLWPLLKLWVDKYPNLIFAAPISDFKTKSFAQYQLDTAEFPPYSVKGIPEPSSTVEISPGLTDIAFIPLLAADVYGSRVGYGAGFYDRFLAQCAPECIKIGVALYGAIEGVIAHEQHDIKLDYYASPTELIKTRP